MLDYWRLTREPFGMFMAIDYLRKNSGKKIEVDVWGLTEWPNTTWQAVLQWLYEDDIIAFKGNTQDPMKDIYHKVDVVLSASSEETRVVREGFSCGVPVVCGHGGLDFTDYSEEMINVVKLAETIDRAHEDLCRDRTKIRRGLRRYAKSNFDVERAAKAMVDVFENVVAEHGSVNRAVHTLTGGERQVHSVKETAEAIRKKMEAEEPLIYTRFGDGQLLLLDGHEGWDYWHHKNDKLQGELRRAFENTEHPSGNYMLACSAGQENEGKMRNGLFARHQSDDKLRKIARGLRPEGTYHNAIALTYQSVFDVDWFCSFLDEHIRPANTLLVCNEMVAQSELVNTVLKPDFIVIIPTVDAYNDIDRIIEEVDSHAYDVTVIMSAAGPISNVLGTWTLDNAPQLTFLDIGSIADGLAGIQSHGWIRMVGQSYLENYSARYNEGVPVDIIVPTYGCPEKTKACFESLQASGAKNYRVIWSDNGSTQEELDEVMPVADLFETCELIHFDDAVGFSAAVNAGMKHSLDTGEARYVLLLNNDVIVTEDFLQRSITSLEGGKHAAVGPLTSENNPHSLEALRGVFPELPVFNGETTPERSTALWDKFGAKTLTPVNMLSFFCCLFRRRVIREIGSLDENLFAYGEDNDYCQRVLRAGQTLGVAVGVYVHHEHHATTETKFPEGWVPQQQAIARRYLTKKYADVADEEAVGPFWQ